MKFKVGDKVRVRPDLETGKRYKGNWNFNTFMEKYKGKEATVKRVNGDNYRLDIDCGEWGWAEDMLEPVETETIVIFRRGKEVIALDKRTDKRGVAKCSPEDKFDFMVGAKLRFERLTTQPKCKVGDIVTVKGDSYHNFKDGAKGIVTSYDEHDGSYGVVALRKDGNRTTSQWLRPEHLEVVE